MTSCTSASPCTSLPRRSLNSSPFPPGDHFFRPLGYISYAIDALWAGHSPALWHLATLLIHFANCVLVYLVARQTGLARFFAATAAVIFGVHGSRPEVVTLDRLPLRRNRHTVRAR